MAGGALVTDNGGTGTPTWYGNVNDDNSNLIAMDGTETEAEIVMSREYTIGGPFFGGTLSTTTARDYAALNSAITEEAAAGGPNVKVWNGSAWVQKPLKIWNGSAWVQKPLKVWTGSAWRTL